MQPGMGDVNDPQQAGATTVDRPVAWRHRWPIGFALTILGVPALFCWVLVGFGGGVAGYVGIAAAMWTIVAIIPVFFVFGFVLPRWPMAVVWSVLDMTILSTAKVATFPPLPEGTLGYISAWLVASTGFGFFGAVALVGARHMNGRRERSPDTQRQLKTKR